MKSNYSNPFLAKARRLYFSGQLDELIELSNQNQDTAVCYDTELLKSRALMDLGLFSQADARLSAALEDSTLPPAFKPIFMMWHAVNGLIFLERYSIRKVLTVLQDQQRLFVDDIYVNALYHNLKSRVVYYGIAVGQYSQLKAQSAKYHLRRSARLYRQAEDWRESCRITINHLIEVLSGQNPDYNYVIKRLRKDMPSTSLEDEYVFACRFRLIELKAHFLKDHLQEAGKPEGYYLGRFKDLHQHYLDRHVHGAETVWLELGELFLKFGYENGQTLLWDVLKDPADFSQPIRRQHAWQALGSWHRERGEMVLAAICDAESAALGRRFEFAMSHDVSVVSELHSDFVTGNTERIIKKSRHYLRLRGNSLLSFQVRTMLAQALFLSGQHELGQIEVDKIISFYQRAKPSTFYCEILKNYADFIFPSFPHRALFAMEEAVGMASQLGNQINQGEYYTLFAQYLTRMKGQSFSGLTGTYTALGCLEKAVGIFASMRGFQATGYLGEAYQNIGSLYFSLGDTVKADQYFQLANRVFSFNHLGVNLAFLQSHQGLLLLSKAEKVRDKSLAELALRLMRRAQKCFWKMGLWQNAIRATYHQGLSYMVLANLCEDHTLQDRQWQLADQYFSRAASISKIIGRMSHQPMHFEAENQKMYRKGFWLNFQQRSNPQKALIWIERMKGQLLMDRIAAVSAMRKAGSFYTEQLAELAHKKLTEKKRVVKFRIEQRMQNLAKAQFSTEALNASLRRELKRQFSWERLQYALSKIRTPLLIVEYYYEQDNLFVSLIRAGWQQPVIVRREFEQTVLQDTLKRIFARSGSEFVSNPDFYQTLWDSQSWLIELADKWGDEKDLICIVPYGILHDCPLHTLKLKDERMLIERNQVFYVPSLNVLVDLLKRREKIADRLPILQKSSVFGNPTGDLPEAEAEADYTANLLNTRPYKGANASKDRFLKAYVNSSVLHFSGHGQAPLNKGFGQYILLADQQKLFAADLLYLSKGPALLTLSGCETGVSQTIIEGDELPGFLHAALASGCRSVLLTNSKIKDYVGYQFFDEFYTNLVSLQKSVHFSFRAAVLKMRDSGEEFSSWASFMLYGFL
jgi:CHAT domain-containing protein